MKYIVDKAAEIIDRSAPTPDGESMIRVDGFEDIKFYVNLAQRITDDFDGTGLTVDIKLAKNKCDYFASKQRLTSYLQAMKQHGWVAENESITRYRNLHNSNLLVLMGTESEEDKGGLANCFCVTADTIVSELDGQYSEVFSYLSEFSDADKAIINKLYHDLFAYVPVDIAKLSKFADDSEGCIDNIGDFIALFFSNLHIWGLPDRKYNLPNSRELKGRKNVLELEYKFISRSLFKRMTKRAYLDYQRKLYQYKEEAGTYGPGWYGWEEQGIHSYDEFSDIVMEYARGENVRDNKERLLKTEFDIVESVLGIKLSKSPKKTNTVTKLTGSPLLVFTKALMYTLLNCDREGIGKIIFDVSEVEIVSLYSGVDGTEEKEQVVESWKTICRHVNGVVDIINQRSWLLDDISIEIKLSPENIFSPGSAFVNVNQGIVKATNSWKTASKVEFRAKCYAQDGTFYEKISPRFMWEFPDTSAWVHDFSDICSQTVCESVSKSYVPLSVTTKMIPMIFAKSDEEFFDLYDESNIDFSFNIVDFVSCKAGNNGAKYTAQFIKLGYAFYKFITVVKEEGFYASIGKGAESEVVKLVNEYIMTGDMLTGKIPPENLRWVLDCFIHAFCIEESDSVLKTESDVRCAIVPPWHPASLQKMLDQKNFFLDGCLEWWNEARDSDRETKHGVDAIINNLAHMSLIQSAVDLFPSSGQQYFGLTASFGDFSIYARTDIENNSRLKDIIHKDAVFNDDFNPREFSRMNDNAQMLYGVIYDYVRAFSNDNNLSIVFVNPAELQPIVAAVYKYIDYVRKSDADVVINVTLKILVKPENKGGRNYLSYWMDEFFSQDANVNIRTYLNEWSSNVELDKFLNGNNDIVFMMNLLTVNNLVFSRDYGAADIAINECRFPIVYKPAPISETTVKRKIELSQPQFGAAYAHTQVVRFRNNIETVPGYKYIAVREVCIDKNVQDTVYKLHSKAYWVVCIDSGMDGALLRNDREHRDEYSIIGFSTGKGAYGQYNLTITSRKSILVSIKKRLSVRLYQLFKWGYDKVKQAADVCISEAGKLDGISLFSAINQRDHNINEFMAYVLTSLREKKAIKHGALKIMIHLDSYKHWFNDEVEKNGDDSASRPDFLMLEAESGEEDRLHLKATVIECKIASVATASEHKEKAIHQVEHGIIRLAALFDPNSYSVRRRYWYAQLYRALAFAQVTFSDESQEFAVMASRLRSLLDGAFDISWSGKVLGYWLDMIGDEENTIEIENQITVVDIPQRVVQGLLLPDDKEIDFVDISNDLLTSAEEQSQRIEEREKELNRELKAISRRTVSVQGNNHAQVLESRQESTYGGGSSSGSASALNEVEGNGDEKMHVQPRSIKSSSESDSMKGNEGGITQESLKSDVFDNTAENEGNDGIRVLIGTDKLYNQVYWEFGNPSLANRHLLITGTSGQGKTYSIQTMLYELSRSNISAIVFDYTEGFRLDQLEQPFVERMGDKIKQHIIYYTGVPINPFKRQDIEVAGMSMPEKPADVAARIANIFKHVYGFGDQQFSAIFEAARKGLEKYKDAMTMKHFQEMLEEEKAHNKTAQSVLSKMAPFFYSIEFNSEKKFDWGSIIYGGQSELNIFQLTSIDREMQVIITELMLWDAWYYTKKNGSKDRPFVAILDEAQNLSHKSNSPSAAILTEGRKFGWSAWFATQSVKVLADDEVVRLMQAANKLYFKPTDDEIVKMAKQLDPTDGSLWLSSLKNLKKGQCIVVGNRAAANGRFGATKPTITTVTSFEERD